MDRKERYRKEEFSRGPKPLGSALGRPPYRFHALGKVLDRTHHVTGSPFHASDEFSRVVHLAHDIEDCTAQLAGLCQHLHAQVLR